MGGGHLVVVQQRDELGDGRALGTGRVRLVDVGEEGVVARLGVVARGRAMPAQGVDAPAWAHAGEPVDEVGHVDGFPSFVSVAGPPERTGFGAWAAVGAPNVVHSAACADVGVQRADAASSPPFAAGAPPQPRAGATSVAMSSIERSTSSCGGSTECTWNATSVASAAAESRDERLHHLVDRADVRVVRRDELVERVADRRLAGPGEPGRRAAESELRPVARLVARVRDEERAGGEDPRRHAIGQRLAVRVDHGQLQLGERASPARSGRHRRGPRLRAREHEAVARSAGARAAERRERRLPDAPEQVATRRLQVIGRVAELAARERGDQCVELLAEDAPAILRVLAEREERRGRRARAEPELGASARQQVEHDRVLGDPHRVLERQRDDAGAEPDPRRDRGGVREEHERRRQAALRGVEVVLRDPGRVEAVPFGGHDLLGRDAIALGGGGLVEQAGEESDAGHAMAFLPGTASSSSRV